MNLFKRKTTVILMIVLSVLVLGAAPVERVNPPAVSSAKAGDYTRVFVKLKVPNLEALTAESTKYKVINPGETFPQAGYDADLNLKKAIDEVADAVLLQLNGKGYAVTRRFSVIPYLSLEVSTVAKTTLDSIGEVEAVTESKVYRVGDTDTYDEQVKSAASSSGAPGLSSPKLQNTVNIVGASDVWNMGITGEGYYVAMLDTGIRNSHNFFDGKDIVEKCYSIESHCPNLLTEDEGPGSAAHHSSIYAAWDHGTWVTGVAAGHKSDDTLNGVAKGANIIAVQVCSHYNNCSFVGYPGPCVAENEEDVLSGLEYVYSLRGTYPIAAVNMSLGDQQQHGTACDGDPNYGIITAIVSTLKSAGIASVAASGNESYCNGINAPACISDVISAGGSTDSDLEWSGNNWHDTLLNLFAPCHQIYTSEGASDNDYGTVWSGTSLAAPHVVGAFTLLKQACPEATVDELLTALETTGVDVYPIGCGTQLPTPRIQIDDAIDSLNDSIVITAPQGGEWVSRGYEMTIDWTTCGFGGDVMIVAESNMTSYIIESAYPFDGAPYVWRIPDTFPLGDCRVRVFQGAINAYSDWFHVGLIAISRPAGGEIYAHGGNMTIEWDTRAISGDVMLVLQTYLDPTHIEPHPIGVSYLIDDQVPYNGSPYVWQVPDTIYPDHYRVMVIKDRIMEYSRPVTVIAEGYIAVNMPQEGDAFPLNGTMRIDWTSAGITGDVEILMVEAYPRELPPLTYTIESAYPYDRVPYEWVIPGTVQLTEYYILVRQGDIKGKSGIFKITQ